MSCILNNDVDDDDGDEQNNNNNTLCSKNTAPFYFFAITLSKRFTVKKLLAHIYSNKFGAKRHQNHQSLEACLYGLGPIRYQTYLLKMSITVHVDHFSTCTWRVIWMSRRLLPIGGHNDRPMLQRWGLVYTLWSLVFTALQLVFVTAFYTKRR